jgi:hypothetical protein
MLTEVKTDMTNSKIKALCEDLTAWSLDEVLPGDARACISVAIEALKPLAEGTHMSGPVEPTEAMSKAGAAAIRDFYSEDGPDARTKAIYCAMLAASGKETT